MWFQWKIQIFCKSFLSMDEPNFPIDDGPDCMHSHNCLFYHTDVSKYFVCDADRIVWMWLAACDCVTRFGRRLVVQSCNLSTFYLFIHSIKWPFTCTAKTTACINFMAFVSISCNDCSIIIMNHVSFQVSIRLVCQQFVAFWDTQLCSMATKFVLLTGTSFMCNDFMFR